MMKKCILCKIVTLLAGIGALNWGLVAILNMNLVTLVLGDMTMPAKVVYALVGASGLVVLISLFVSCPGCKKG